MPADGEFDPVRTHSSFGRRWGSKRLTEESWDQLEGTNVALQVVSICEEVIARSVLIKGVAVKPVVTLLAVGQNLIEFLK